jgi:hypothetical protein
MAPAPDAVETATMVSVSLGNKPCDTAGSGGSGLPRP